MYVPDEYFLDININTIGKEMIYQIPIFLNSKGNWPSLSHSYNKLLLLYYKIYKKSKNALLLLYKFYFNSIEILLT